MLALRASYRDIKQSWEATIAKASQGVIKEIMNQILINQRVMSFLPSDWGELSDYKGLQDNLVRENEIKIDELIIELEAVVGGLSNIVARLQECLDIEKIKEVVVSTRPELIEQYVGQLYQAHKTELDLRQQIVSDLKSRKYNDASYEVITTVTAIWSGRCYTNDRSLEHVEKFINFECTSH